MTFERGQRVEILNLDKGFENSFYPANVISQVSEKRYIIQYSTICKEKYIVGCDEDIIPLREFKEEHEIRPTPPELQVISDFVVNDKVDAYYQDGWWYGRIRGVEEGEIKKYVVHFKGSNNSLEFEVGDLRMHQVWSQGQWSTT